ncbi:MAG: hypothetical protein ACK4Z5_10355 [Brevundimonas sp.]
MNTRPTPALIPLGRARSRTRADQETGVLELIPTSFWQVSAWTR